MRIILFLLFITAATLGWGQISLTTIGTPYTQDFNTLVNTGTSSTLPAGWFFNESGTGANSTYTAGTGSSATGDTYSFGTAAADRALGGLLSGSVTPTFGASFTNNTGSIITSIDLAFIGEQWRMGTAGRVDRIDFQYSVNATSLITGAWTDVNTLDFTAPTTTGVTGALNGNSAANRTSISSSITSLSIAIGATFWIRWNDLNASGSDDGLSVDDFSLTPFTTSSNTITTTAVATSPFALTCNTSATGNVDFTTTGTFNLGNIFTAELSDAAGSFSSPTEIGTLTGASAEGLNPSGSINFTIPSTTATGTGYLIRIVSSNPFIIGTNSGANTITLSGGPCTLTPPYMTSLIYDGCNSACSGGSTEGRSEIIFGNTGGYSVEVNPTNVNFIYNTNGNQPLTSGLVNNTTATANLNTEASCSGLFLDGFGQTLSPNTSFLVVSQNLCITSLIWSDLCGSGPIYVLYASASPTTWNDGGNFGNSSGTRNLQTIITSSDGSVHNISYSYTSVNGGDGSYATWSSDGGAPSTSGIFSNCRLTPVALPSGISLFKAVSDRTNAQLYWQTNSEQNNDYFTIAHSTSGYDFEVLGQVQGAGNSSTLNDYQLIHSRPSQGINYYKLTSTDFDGTTYIKGIVSLLFNSNGYYFDAQTSEIMFNERSDYRIFSMDGKLLGEVINETSLLFNQQGIVLIQDLRTGLTERLFVP